MAVMTNTQRIVRQLLIGVKPIEWMRLDNLEFTTLCDRVHTLAGLNNGNYGQALSDALFEVENRRTSRTVLVITFDGTEDNDCLTKVQETIAYLRACGWKVEEKDV